MIDRENKKIKHASELKKRKEEKKSRVDIKPSKLNDINNTVNNMAEGDLKVQISELKDNHNKLIIENKEVSKMSLKMRNEYEETAKNVEELKAQSNNLKSEVTNYSEILEQLKHDKEKLDYELKAKTGEIEIEISNQKSRVDVLKNEALLLNKDIEDNEILKSKLYSSVETLKSEVYEIEKVKEKLSTEIENKQEEINNVNSELFIEHYKKYYEVNKKQIDEELMTLTETDIKELLVYRSDIIKHEFPLSLVHKLVKNEIDKI